MSSMGEDVPKPNTQRRRRNSTLTGLMEMEHSSDAIFNILKDKKREKVSIFRMFTTIERAGVERTDPRIKEFVRKIDDLQKNYLQNDECTKSMHLLDKETFKSVVADNVSFLHRILKNDFIIPEFYNFCEIIKDVYESCIDNDKGALANYIPQLARFDPKLWGVAVCTIDGQRYNLGDSKTPFCMQSMCMPLNYALAMTELGADEYHKYVGYEPSGVSFNSISLNAEDKPHNPLINSGAIVTVSLLKNKMNLADRFDYIISEYKRMAENEFIGFSNSTFLSERESADRNFALAYFMREKKCFPDKHNIKETLDLYFQLCSVEFNCQSGSVIAATLANGGISPLTGQRIFSGAAVRDTLSLMYSCGMYDYSGQFAFKVGLPAKSGVSGGILLVVPNLMGICVWSPPLDKQGNSCRGVQFCSELVARFNFHNYDSLLHNTGEGLGKIDPRKTKSEVKGDEVVKLLFGAYNNDVSTLRRAYLSDVNMSQKDYDGRTALHVAAAEGNMSAVEFLIGTCHVDVHIRDRWGHTAEDDANNFEKKDVIDYLASLNLDMNL